jgi:hypothetical protein
MPAARWVGSGGAFLALCAIGSIAQAESSETRLPVIVEVRPCLAETLNELQRIVGAELDARVTARPKDEPRPPSREGQPDSNPPRGSDDPSATLVEVSCEDEWVRLDVLDPVSGKNLVRHVDLRQTEPSIRTRMLALSVAELVAASWIELASRRKTPAPIAEARAPETSKEVALSAAERTFLPPPSYAIEAVFALRRMGAADLTTAGGGARASFVHHGWLALGGDLLVEGGSADVPLGSIRTILASGSVSARLRQRTGWLAVEGGIGVRVGLAQMQGVAADVVPRPETRASTLPWAGPMAMVRLEADLPKSFILVAGIEAGRVTRAADGRVDGRTELSIDKDWIVFTVGPGLSFGE